MAISVTVALAERGVRVATYVAQRTFDAPEVTIGSNPASDVHLPDARVQPVHARLIHKNGAYALVDDGAAGGTLLDGVRLEPRRPKPVRGGEVVQVGPYRLELAIGPAGAGRSPGSTFSLAIALLEKETGPAREHSAPRLEIIDGPDRTKRLLLEEGRDYTLGRDRNADLPLEEPEASRQHARVSLREGVMWLRDLGSSNGTYLRGASLPAGQDVAWPPGAEMRIGDDRLVYRDPLAEALDDVERRPGERLDVLSPPAEPPQGMTPEGSVSLPRGRQTTPATSTPEPPPQADAPTTEATAAPTSYALAALAASDAKGAIVEPPPAVAAIAGQGGAPKRWRWDAPDILLVVAVAGVLGCIITLAIWTFGLLRPAEAAHRGRGGRRQRSTTERLCPRRRLCTPPTFGRRHRP